MLTIRGEMPADYAAIHQVHAEAFGRPHEARLVEALRAAGALTVSLVAVQDDQLVGHIAFSPVRIVSANGTLAAIGLAPMAVLPAYQGRGIGSKLVQAGLDACGETPYGIVVVLGHAHYYPRFGFVPARPHGLVWEHEAPEEAFMVREIRPGALAGVRGTVKYAAAFDAV